MHMAQDKPTSIRILQSHKKDAITSCTGFEWFFSWNISQYFRIYAFYQKLEYQ